MASNNDAAAQQQKLSTRPGEGSSDARPAAEVQAQLLANAQAAAAAD